MTSGSRKMGLLFLLNYHRVTMASLAYKAGVQIPTIQAMVWEISVPKKIAEQVLATLSTMVSSTYTLDEVVIKVYEESDDATVM